MYQTRNHQLDQFKGKSSTNINVSKEEQKEDREEALAEPKTIN